MKILVVDDHILFREGLVSLLSKEKDFKVAAQAGSVKEAVQMARKHQPDMILMDFSLPDGTGADASNAILLEFPTCQIVFLTVFDEDEQLFEAVRSGAKGYLLKNTPITRLVAALRSLQRGEAAISPSMALRIMGELSRSRGEGGHDANLLEQLSQRELEVLRCLLDGASNTDIADRLVISLNTVKHHVRSILDKLDVKNRREAARIARSLGLTVPFPEQAAHRNHE